MKWRRKETSALRKKKEKDTFMNWHVWPCLVLRLVKFICDKPRAHRIRSLNAKCIWIAKKNFICTGRAPDVCFMRCSLKDYHKFFLSHSPVPINSLLLAIYHREWKCMTTAQIIYWTAMYDIYFFFSCILNYSNSRHTWAIAKLVRNVAQKQLAC